jgi:hypothetical protein
VIRGRRPVNRHHTPRAVATVETPRSTGRTDKTQGNRGSGQAVRRRHGAR